MKKHIGMNLFYLITMVLLVACTKSDTTCTLEMSSPLKDQGFLKITVDVVMEKKSDLEEVAHKAQNLNRAFSIVFREYYTRQLKGTGRGTVNKVLERIFDSMIQAKVEHFKIVDYSVRDPKQ